MGPGSSFGGSLKMAINTDVSLNTSLDADQREKYQNTKVIQGLLLESKVIAVVGLSTEKTKASNMVATYLQGKSYKIVPIHPKADEILGEKAYPSLLDVPFQIDIVDVFRPASELRQIVDQSIDIGARAVWAQLRIIDFEAADIAMESGLCAILDKCIKMEHGRYTGMLHWAGMNTEVISAKRRK